MLPDVVAAINHGVCIEPRCACADALARELRSLGVRAEVQKHSKSALEGAQRTIRRALEHARRGDRILYLEDDARLAPDFAERIAGVLHVEPPGVVLLFSARDRGLDVEWPGDASLKFAARGETWLEHFARPVAGAVAVLLSREAAELATLEAHRRRPPEPVERVFVAVGKVHGDATAWPSLVDHRGELESTFKPGAGGKGTFSPSFAARYQSEAAAANT